MWPDRGVEERGSPNGTGLETTSQPARLEKEGEMEELKGEKDRDRKSRDERGKKIDRMES